MSTYASKWQKAAETALSHADRASDDEAVHLYAKAQAYAAMHAADKIDDVAETLHGVIRSLDAIAERLAQLSS